MESAHHPLNGVRVIDASSFLTGPLAAMMLADLGADVVKVEPPAGDTFRRFGKRHHGYGISFANANRNKRGVVVDLREQEGRDAFDGLLATADILFTNWRPATTAALGLGPQTVQRHPRLIWVRITGFGPDGPMADLPAFDATIQALSGLASVQGGDQRPALVQSWLCDKVTALFATQAALAGLVERGRTGQGRLIDVPMLDAVAYFNFPDLMVERTLLPSVGPPVNRQLRATEPVPTRDGWILIAPVGGRQLKRALVALGREAEGDGLRAVSDPGEFTAAFYRLTASVTPERTTAEWLHILKAHDVPAAPVLDLDAHLADPQVDHNAVYATYDDPRLGAIRQVRHPFVHGDPVQRPFPDLGEHSAEVLGG